MRTIKQAGLFKIGLFFELQITLNEIFQLKFERFSILCPLNDVHRSG